MYICVCVYIQYMCIYICILYIYMYTCTPALNTPLPPNPLPPLSFFCDFHFYPHIFPSSLIGFLELQPQCFTDLPKILKMQQVIGQKTADTQIADEDRLKLCIQPHLEMFHSLLSDLEWVLLHFSTCTKYIPINTLTRGNG